MEKHTYQRTSSGLSVKVSEKVFIDIISISTFLYIHMYEHTSSGINV